MTMINRAADIAPDNSATEAAPGIVRVDVKVSTPAERNALSYASREKIYAKLAHGTFRNIKWAVMAVTLGIYYLLPWIRWNRGPSLPDQAFLLDFANQRLFFGPIEIWAQELYYITGLLIIVGARAVSRHRRRRAHVVRLYVPADGVDRSHDRGRALLAGGPQRPHPPRQRPLDV